MDCNRGSEKSNKCADSYIYNDDSNVGEIPFKSNIYVLKTCCPMRHGRYVFLNFTNKYS